MIIVYRLLQAGFIGKLLSPCCTQIQRSFALLKLNSVSSAPSVVKKKFEAIVPVCSAVGLILSLEM